MDEGAWWAAVHGVAKSRTWLSDFTLTFHFPALEKEMATHSSVLAWRIPGMGEPRGLTSMGSHRVGHDWSGLAVAVAAVRLEKGEIVFIEPILCGMPEHIDFLLYIRGLSDLAQGTWSVSGCLAPESIWERVCLLFPGSSWVLRSQTVIVRISSQKESSFHFFPSCKRNTCSL